MAQVTGMTAEKIFDLTADSLVSAAIDSQTGVLTLTTRGGQTISAGNVSTLRSVDKAYPVGSIFMSTLATSPATQLGIGTWQSWGKGQVPVGVDPNQVEFDSSEKTGGEKAHVLTQSEMPQHTHTDPVHTHTDPAHYHDMYHDHPAGTTSSTGSHEHEALWNDVDGGDIGTYRTGAVGGRANDNGALINQAGAHTHTFDVPPFGGSTGMAGGGQTGEGGGGQTGPAGTGAAHNNMPPYITCYMWKRTA